MIILSHFLVLDPLYQNVDPRIRIRMRIHLKIVWIRNPAKNTPEGVVSMKVQQLQATLSREIPFLIPTTTTPYTKSKSPTPRDELESLIMPPI